MASTAARDSLTTTAKEREQAAALFTRRQGGPGTAIEALQVGGRQVPAELGALLERVLRAVASGRTVTIGTLPAELTTSAAAGLLGISRPTLMKLINEKHLPAHKVGSHTRINTTDALAFARARLEQQRDAFAALRALEDELDLK